MNVRVHSTAQFAYQRIKDSIINLGYAPGEKLSEVRLAEELGVGRSPVRSALARLVNEGWLDVLPQNGTFVRQLRPHEVRELAELRELLEVHVTRKAASTISDEELKKLHAEFDLLAARGVEENFPAFLELDDRFHTAIHVAANNGRIAEILRNLKEQIHWIRITTATLPGRVTSSFEEMRDVLKALERRDADAAAEAMRCHVGNIADTFESMPQNADAPADSKQTRGVQ